MGSLPRVLCWTILILAFPAAYASPPSGIRVTVAHPVRSHWRATTEYLAKVDSFGRLPVTAPTSGWFSGPHLMQGARVKAGMILGTIKPLGFDAQLRAAESALRLAQIQLRQARRLYEAHDNAILALDKAENSYHEASANVQALKMKQSAYRLRAPADGTLHYRIPYGAFVNDANVTPIIAYVDVSHPLWISVNVPSSQAQELRPGERVALRRGDWNRDGKVSSIDDSALPFGLVQVIVRPPTGSPLRAGEWIRVALPGKPGNGWRLPRAALLMQGNRSFIYLLQHGRARAVSVHLQNAAGSWVWVSGPLDTDSQVIVKGADRVVNGTRVRLVQATNLSRA